MAKTDAKSGKNPAQNSAENPAKAAEESPAAPKPASDRKNGEVKNGKVKNGKVKGFDIEAEELPEAIVDAAYHSGGYPYGKRMKRKRYDRELLPLQIELLKLTHWAAENGERIVVVFEGRDGAGKGGTISRFTQHLPPRQARIVALPKPSDTEKGQWYFQRYAAQMPAAGEIVLFDRSWYNRAGVERVMGFCTPEETESFLREAPVFEGMLARDGIRLVKLFMTIGREMQMTRLHARWHDPLKRWKLSPIDFQAIQRFDDYSRAFDAMLGRTSSEAAPWYIVRSNDKLRARLNAIRHALKAIPYKGKDEDAIGQIDHEVVIPVDRYLDNGGEPEGQ